MATVPLPKLLGQLAIGNHSCVCEVGVASELHCRAARGSYVWPESYFSNEHQDNPP